MIFCIHTNYSFDVGYLIVFILYTQIVSHASPFVASIAERGTAHIKKPSSACYLIRCAAFGCLIVCHGYKFRFAGTVPANDIIARSFQSALPVGISFFNVVFPV